MKHIILHLFLAAFMLGTFDLSAQDLSHLELKAHYTLIGTAEDVLGNLDTMELINAPFRGDSGVYSFGGYIWDDINEDSTLISTPDLEVLNDTAFAVSLEFMADTLDGTNRQVIAIGDSWRYLGLRFLYDSTFMAMHNGLFFPIDEPKLQVGKWHNVTISYRERDSLSTYFIDGTEVLAINKRPEHPEHDINVSNTHFGQGNTFLGFWRNVKIYGPKVTSYLEGVEADLSFAVYPNPSRGSVFISWEFLPQRDDALQVTDMSGRVLENFNPTGTHLVIDDLPPGIFTLTWIRNGRQLVAKRFIVGKQ